MSSTKDLNVTFSGCGFLGIYHLGVVSCLKDNAPAFLDRVKCYGGTSAGAFAATALLMDLNITESAEFVLRLAKRANSLTLGPLHPHFRIVNTVKKSFQKILPENAHEIASGRLHISLTRVSDFKNIIVSEYTSKEDLIEALLATSHVPFYSSVLPAKFRGVYYVDGGITDNLPQHFEGETITVSPFSGESDICPQDGSPNLAYFDLRNTSVQFTLQNLYRCSRAFFPPEVEALCEMCKQGYRDTMRFLQIHYPATLSKESLRRKPSSVFRPSVQSDSILTNQLLGRHRAHTSSTSSMSAYSMCSTSEAEVFSTAQDDQEGQEGQEGQDRVDGQDVQDDLDDGTATDGESRLSIMLDRTHQSITENELWSCYFIRKAMWVFKLAAKPCVLSVRQITNLAHAILEYLPVIEKTGIEFMDQLLAMVYVMVHTYKNKHKVHHSKHDIVATKQYPRPWTRTQTAIQEASIELVHKWRLVSSHHHHHHLPPPTPSPQDSSSEGEMNVSDGIEVIQDDSYSSNASAGYDMCTSGEYNMQCPVGCKVSSVDKCSRCSARLCKSKGCLLTEDYDMCTSLTLSVTSLVSEEQHDANLGMWENEGGACYPFSPVVSSGADDYIVLDGYETDVESMISTDNGEDRDFMTSMESSL